MALKPSTVRTLYVWHKWTGLITGVFIFFICFTGALLVFKDEIDRVITPAKVVRPQAEKAPLDQVMANVRIQFPGAQFRGIIFPKRPDAAYEITGTQLVPPPPSTDGATSANANPAKRRAQVLTIFVNPYTGLVTGSRSGETFANVLRQLHLRFYYFGLWGRIVVGVFGVALLFSTISGAIIYWRFMRSLWNRGLHWWSVRGGLQLGTSDLHKLIGIAALAFNLVIALTGAVLGLENLAVIAPVISETLQHRPQSVNARGENAPGGQQKVRGNMQAQTISFDQAVRTSVATLPGFEPQGMSLAGGNIMVTGKTGGLLARDNTAYVILNDAAGNVVETFQQSQGTIANRLYYLVEPLHYGAFGGLTSKIIYLVCGFTGAFLSITGFMLWLLKRRKGHSHPVASPERVLEAV